MGSQCLASTLQLVCLYLMKGKKGADSEPHRGPWGFVPVGTPGAVGGHWEQGGGGCWCSPAQETRHGFGRWKILERLFLCWLQVHTVCTSLQSHAGLIMSSSKHNLFTECAGLCHQHCSEPTGTAHRQQTPPRASHPRDRDTARDTARGSTPLLALGAWRHGGVSAIHPFQQQHWAPCLWVGGRMSCQLRSVICSSL